MSQLQAVQSPELDARRRAVSVRVLVVVGLLAAGLGGMKYANNYFHLVKDPAPLNKDLKQLATSFGPYVKIHEDRKLDAETVSQLGTEEYLLRRYRDNRKAPGELGAVVSLNLNFYATGSATPHVPDICWAGNGLVRGEDGMFVVEQVPHMDGHTSAIRMRRLSFIPPRRQDSMLPILLENDNQPLVNVAYVFQVNDGYVSTANEVTKHFWNPKSRYAYHTKIELTITNENGSPQPCDPKLAEPIFADFLRAALPEIEDCLPDPAKLENPGGPAGGVDRK